MANPNSVAKMATEGLAQHPRYFGAKLEPGMKFPGDTRLLRNIKLHEVPQWLAKRDFSPLGMFFSLKRWKHGFQSKYLLCRRPGGNFYAMNAVAFGIIFYVLEYPWIKAEAHRKYH